MYVFVAETGTNRNSEHCKFVMGIPINWMYLLVIIFVLLGKIRKIRENCMFDTFVQLFISKLWNWNLETEHLKF